MNTQFYEDFAPGWTATSRPLTVTQEEIIDFARQYDRQPFHTDPELAKHTFPGRLIASGWHSCALMNKLLAESLLLKIEGQGGPGVDETRWIAPLFPGDEINLRITVEETRTLRSRPETGLLILDLRLLKRDGTVSTSMRVPVMIRRRTPGEPMPAAARPAREPAGQPAEGGVVAPNALLFVEEMKPGTVTEPGSYTFSAEEIIRFARAFDPQYFHLDAEAAKNSLFGGLCASGWHTAAAWMGVTSQQFREQEEKLRRAGSPIPTLGPSPGFTNLKWLKPVFAGDTVTYRNMVTGTRASASRPGWGLLFSRNGGYNQHGEKVFEFESTVLRQMRPD